MDGRPWSTRSISLHPDFVTGRYRGSRRSPSTSRRILRQFWKSNTGEQKSAEERILLRSSCGSRALSGAKMGRGGSFIVTRIRSRLLTPTARCVPPGTDRSEVARDGPCVTRLLPRSKAPGDGARSRRARPNARVQLQRIPIRVRAERAHNNCHPLSAATFVRPQHASLMEERDVRANTSRLLLGRRS